MAKKKPVTPITKWTPVEFVHRARELRARLNAWHEWSPDPGYGGTGPLTLTAVSEWTHHRFRKWVSGTHGPRPRTFCVMSIGPFVTIDEPGAKLPKSLEFAGVSVPETLTDKALTVWSVSEYFRRTQSDAGDGHRWTLLRCTFEEVLDLHLFSFGPAESEVEHRSVHQQANPLAVHFVRCRQLEPHVLDNFVSAAERLIENADAPTSQKPGNAGTNNFAECPIRKEPQFVSDVGTEFRVPSNGLDSELDAAPLKVFFSYARADAKQRLKLAEHLAPLERIGLIRGWYDNEILPGAEFEQEIADKLAEADIVLLLISPGFTASKYCYEIELQTAMKRRAKDEVCVLPIIVRATNAWKKLPAGTSLLGSLDALPTSGKPIPQWKPQDDGWADVASGVQRAAEALREKKK